MIPLIHSTGGCLLYTSGKYKISGVPICRDGKLVGILTNRDMRFLSDFTQRIEEVMTKENLVTAPVGTTMEQAQEILRQHRIEKLPIVDDNGYLKGLITIKDIEKAVKYPLSARDKDGRLLCAAAIGATSDVLDSCLLYTSCWAARACGPS